MQCPTCKNEVDSQSAFCNRCGAPMTAAAGEATVPPLGASSGVGTGSGYGAVPNYGPATDYGAAPNYAAPPAYGTQPVMSAPGLSTNAASAIAYLTIIPAIILLVLEPYSRIPLVRFHAWQSLGLGVGAVLLQIVVTICEVALHFIPGIILLFTLVHLVIGLGLFVLWLVAILKASRGEWYKLPLIGDFAERQAKGMSTLA